jgi:hypothetical protein
MRIQIDGNGERVACDKGREMESRIDEAMDVLTDTRSPRNLA